MSRRILITIVAALTVLFLSNLYTVRTTEREVPKLAHIAVDTAVATPIGIYDGGSYGDYGGCGVCLGFQVKDFRGFQLGAFGYYLFIKL